MTRNEDLEVEEDDAENLLKALEKELLRRRFGPPVRLEVEESIDPQVLELLVSELGVAEDEVFRLPGPLDLRGLHGIADLPREDLKYPAFVPDAPTASWPRSSRPRRSTSSRRRGATTCCCTTRTTRSRRRCSASSSRPPPTRTCWRSSRRSTAPRGDSPIIDALVDAAEAGKQVLVIVEIKARFDEQANIRWARKLEQAGCHVVYGLVGLKTHCKLAMVVRDEPDGHPPLHPHRHRQLQPQDRPAVRGPRAAHHRRGDRRGRRPPVQQPLAATPATPPTSGCWSRPDSVRDGPGRADPPRDRPPPQPAGPRGSGSRPTPWSTRRSIDALYLASQAGVPVELLVRGICALRPGVPGLSENIRVRSVLGPVPRAQPGLLVRERRRRPSVWIGSADLMHRNLDRRVEVLVSLTSHHAAAVGAQMDTAFDRGHEHAGTWPRRAASGYGTSTKPDGQRLIDVQEQLLERPAAVSPDRRSNAGRVIQRGWCCTTPPAGSRSSRPPRSDWFLPKAGFEPGEPRAPRTALRECPATGPRARLEAPAARASRARSTRCPRVVHCLAHAGHLRRRRPGDEVDNLLGRGRRRRPRC